MRGLSAVRLSSRSRVEHSVAHPDDSARRMLMTRFQKKSLESTMFHERFTCAARPRDWSSRLDRMFQHSSSASARTHGGDGGGVRVCVCVCGDGGVAGNMITSEYAYQWLCPHSMECICKSCIALLYFCVLLSALHDCAYVYQCACTFACPSALPCVHASLPACRLSRRDVMLCCLALTWEHAEKVSPEVWFKNTSERHLILERTVRWGEVGQSGGVR
jgi:hypothetical protein